MDIKPIRTEADYANTLKRIEQIFDAAAHSPEEDELDVLVTLVEKYEEEHFPIDAPDPVEAIVFRMEQEGLKRSDLEQYLGGKSRVSEVLAKKRALSLQMIRKLHQGLGLPLESLIQSYQLQKV